MKNKNIYYLYKIFNLLKIGFFILFSTWVLLYLVPAFSQPTIFTIKTNIYEVIFARQYFSNSIYIAFILGILTLLLFLITSYFRKKIEIIDTKNKK